MNETIENHLDDSYHTEAHAPRKIYVAPTLTDFGSFAELTHGTFAGVGADSGIYS